MGRHQAVPPEQAAWRGVVFAPKGTPPDVVTTLNSHINEALALPHVQKRLVAAGLDPWQLSQQDMSSFIKTDLARWSVLLRVANVKIQ
jgi:tripartite-type tricarboxylate transporter receptor subunit TctC